MLNSIPHSFLLPSLATLVILVVILAVRLILLLLRHLQQGIFFTAPMEVQLRWGVWYGV